MVTDADANDYPFSMTVDHLLSLHDVISFNRDQYEGEVFLFAYVSHHYL